MKVREVKRYQEIVDALASISELNDDSRRFVESMFERFEKYGLETFISDAQAEWLDRLEERFL